MPDFPYRNALILSALALGVSGSLARRLSALGVKVALAARDIGKLALLVEETGAAASRRTPRTPIPSPRCSSRQASGSASPRSSFTTRACASRARSLNSIRPSSRGRSRSPPSAVSWSRKPAARRMIPHGRGAILFTGASASVKGFTHSAPFAMGQFALRGLAQSAARELGPNHPRRAFRHRRRRSLGPSARPRRAARQHPRSRRDRPDLCRRVVAAAKRMVAGGRTAPVGRALLKAALLSIRHSPPAPVLTHV